MYQWTYAAVVDLRKKWRAQLINIATTVAAIGTDVLSQWRKAAKRCNGEDILMDATWALSTPLDDQQALCTQK